MSMMFEIKVITSSGRSEFVLDKSGVIKCYLKSQPQQGKANKELIKLIAQSVGVSQDDVVILHGLTSRRKKIRVEKQLTEDEFFACLGLSRQASLLKD